MSVYGLQLAVRGMKPYFPPCSEFVNLVEVLYGLISTLMVDMRQYAAWDKRQTGGVLLSGAVSLPRSFSVYSHR